MPNVILIREEGEGIKGNNNPSQPNVGQRWNFYVVPLCLALAQKRRLSLLKVVLS